MVDIPKKYKAIVYDEPGKVSTKIVELDSTFHPCTSEGEERLLAILQTSGEGVG